MERALCPVGISIWPAHDINRNEVCRVLDMNVGGIKATFQEPGRRFDPGSVANMNESDPRILCERVRYHDGWGNVSTPWPVILRSSIEMILDKINFSTFHTDRHIS